MLCHNAEGKSVGNIPQIINTEEIKISKSSRNM